MGTYEIQYTLVEEGNYDGFVAMVRLLMRDGWSPSGGVSVAWCAGVGKIYAQGMIRAVEKKSK